jgi:hypothetical protein
MSSSITADLHTDTRLIERSLAKGFISRKEAAKAIDHLPDVAEKAEWVTIDDADDVEADDEE